MCDDWAQFGARRLDERSSGQKRRPGTKVQIEGTPGAHRPTAALLFRQRNRRSSSRPAQRDYPSASVSAPHECEKGAVTIMMVLVVALAVGAPVRRWRLR